MTYTEYQKQCAFYGLTDTPLTEVEFDNITICGLNDDVYDIGCDMATGMFASVDEAIAWHIAHA